MTLERDGTIGSVATTKKELLVAYTTVYSSLDSPDNIVDICTRPSDVVAAAVIECRNTDVEVVFMMRVLAGMSAVKPSLGIDRELLRREIERD